MKIRFQTRFLLSLGVMLLLTIAGSLSTGWADEIFLEDTEKPVSGQITYEDDDNVEIQTEQYGKLTFKKYRVKEIRRQFGGSTAYSAPTGQPGWGQPAASSNPFGQQPPQGMPAAPAPSNPFATNQTFQSQPAMPVAPVPQAPQWGAPSPTAAVAAQPTPMVTIPTLPSAIEVDAAPLIPAGFDGVMFAIEEGYEVEIKRGSDDPWEPAANNTALLVGNAVRTGEGKVKIRLRGRDTLRLPPRSHIVLVSLSPDASQVTLEVRNGTLWTEVAPRARVSDFKVMTPDLTAGVRGTLFKTTVLAGSGSRVAVLKDTVEVSSQKTGASAMVEENMSVVVNPNGQIEPQKPVLPTEYDEWAAWDEWRLDFYKNVAVFSMVGAPILQGMADQIAQDNAQWADTMNEANRQIVQNRYEDNLRFYADAFMKLAEDTGHIPNPDTDGWQPLLENTGNWVGWNGPYLQAQSLPPLDIYQRPVHYIVRYNRLGGNIHGLIYSEGLNRRDDKGQSSSDDIIAYAMFYQIPKIADNPQYQGQQQANPGP